MKISRSGLLVCLKFPFLALHIMFLKSSNLFILHGRVFYASNTTYFWKKATEIG
jgi:hypothetical protein